MTGSRMQYALRELVNPAVQAQAITKLKAVPENIFLRNKSNQTDAEDLQNAVLQGNAYHQLLQNT
jgi:hypothetical protein